MMNYFFFFQTVAERLFDYTVENTLHVKSFIINGSFPFKNAPENYFIKAMTKRVQPKIIIAKSCA